MSRQGNPYDNAHVESFFKTLKHEEIFANDYSTIDDRSGTCQRQWDTLRD